MNALGSFVLSESGHGKLEIVRVKRLLCTSSASEESVVVSVFLHHGSFFIIFLPSMARHGMPHVPARRWRFSASCCSSSMTSC